MSFPSRFKLFEFFPQGFKIKHQAPSVDLGQVFPGGHRSARHPAGDAVKHILIGRNFPKSRGTKFLMTLGEISGPGAGKLSGGTIAFSGFAMTEGAFFKIDFLSSLDRGLGRRIRHKWVSYAVINKQNKLPDLVRGQCIFP